MLNTLTSASSRQAPISLKRDRHSSVALWGGIAIAVWGETMDDDGLLAVWQACQAGASRAAPYVRVMNIFEAGVNEQVSKEQRRRLLSVMNSRNAFRVVREANVFDSALEIPPSMTNVAPLLGSNVDECRWFDDVEYAAEWLVAGDAISQTPNGAPQTNSSKLVNCPDADGLLEVVSEIRGESTGIRMRLSTLGIDA